MLTVAACLACNQRKGNVDIYLRDVLTGDISTYWKPAARVLLEGQVRRSVLSNRSLLWRSALAGTRWVPIHTPSGIYLGNLPAVRLDGRRLKRVLTLVTKGLFAHSFRQRLPEDCKFDIGRVDPLLVAKQ